MTKLQPAVADKNCREAEGLVQSQVIDIGQVISHHITNYSFPTSTLELCNNTSDIFTSRHTKSLWPDTTFHSNCKIFGFIRAVEVLFKNLPINLADSRNFAVQVFCLVGICKARLASFVLHRIKPEYQS